MGRQAKAQGIAPNYFEAVDGRKGKHELFDKVDQANRLRYKGRPFSAGELGCWASHYSLWQECIKQNKPIIILEDDAILEPNFSYFLQKAQAIGSQFPYFRLFQCDLASKKLVHIEGFNIHRYWRSPLRTTGYLLAPEAAQKLLAHAEHWVLPVDDYMDLSWLHGVDCLGLKPGCISERTKFASTIQTQTPKERLSLKQKLVREGYRQSLRARYVADFFKRSI